VAFSFYGSCFIRDDGTAGCIGYNINGSLDGVPSSDSIDADTARVIPLPGVPVSLASVAYGYCALLSNGSAACWGDPMADGQNDGYANQLAVGLINVGTGMSIKQIVGGLDTYCALLVPSGGVKCWGKCGYDRCDAATMGYASGLTQMGDSLPYIQLGTGLTVSELASGYYHYCALFTSGKAKVQRTTQNSALTQYVRAVLGRRQFRGLGRRALVHGL